MENRCDLKNHDRIKKLGNAMKSLRYWNADEEKKELFSRLSKSKI